MNVQIVAVDKLRESYVRAGCRLYEERLQPIMPVSVRETRPSSSDDAVAIEGQAILRGIGPDDIVWALDPRGTIISSTTLAKMLVDAQRSSRRRLTLAIGGARGLSQAVIERADFVWSLSQLTFLHEMARLVVLEQLYRAVKINRGEPYHR
jgi:23S rRNA (pseudouridine1915-N3)-methyltransferase